MAVLCGSWKQLVTSCATSFGTSMVGFVTQSMSFMNSLNQIQLHQIWKTRIWINRIRKSPQN